jgi:AraC family transcriptional regulator of adaptative response/methylated-DNA-[protein]-cysteine methyltransferase
MKETLFSSMLETPLGPMQALSIDRGLFLLEFADRKGLEEKIDLLAKKENALIQKGKSKAMGVFEKELRAYFEGTLQNFTTPLLALGSPFQKQVWEELKKIPYGETRSYGQVAHAVGVPKAFRAVAGATSRNPLSILIPCHRVILSDGKMGGYSGGLSRKKWLLEHEFKRNASCRGNSLILRGK